MADAIARQAALEPTFNLPTGSASDFYLSREVNDSDDKNNGRIIKKDGLWGYPFLTRRTGDSLVGTNEEITSAEMRHGKTAGKTKIGTASSSGSHDFEFSPETFDDQLEGTFSNRWVRWYNDGAKNLITKDYLTEKGFMHVRGDDGSFNQVVSGKNVSTVPLFYTEAEKGTKEDPYGLIKISDAHMGEMKDSDLPVTRANAKNPLGKFVVHELHFGETPVKYSFISRIPINEDIVRYQNYKHTQIGEMSLNVTVNAIVTGSFNLAGSNNPSYFTQVAEAGKIRMADDMAKAKDVSVGNDSEQFYSEDFADAAEKFLKAVKDTVKSTETDQYTAMEGFLYANGHQLQFCSDLTVDVNKNIQPIYAIFVKNAIANIEPKLDITGSITAYFTDGEMDSTGMKFGTDDLKNLASQNKDVELVWAFQDKEDPESLYLFQIFKSTLSSPQESKDAESPISLSLNYTSYGEMAMRVLRIAIPKIRTIKFDTKSVVDAMRKAEAEGDVPSIKDINITLIPNVPFLDATDTEANEASYVTEDNEDYVFSNAEVFVNAKPVAGATFSGVKINADGSVWAKLTLVDDIAEGDTIQIKLKVNEADCDSSAEIIPSVDYIRMGKVYAKDAVLEDVNDGTKYIEMSLENSSELEVMEASTGMGDEDEQYLFYYFKHTDMNLKASDLVITSSDTEYVSDKVEDKPGFIKAVKETPEGKYIAVTVASKYDSDVKMKFNVKVVA